MTIAREMKIVLVSFAATCTILLGVEQIAPMDMRTGATGVVAFQASGGQADV